MLAGDPEPDKTPTATAVRGRAEEAGRRGPLPCLLLNLSPPPQTSETSHWSGTSPEGPAPLTGKGP